MRKIVGLVGFFAVSPVLLALLFYLVLFKNTRILGAIASPISSVQLFAALPEDTGTLKTEIKAENGSCLAIENYLKKYNSPVVEFASDFCEAAKKYNLDYRILVAIAQQESNLCKASKPEWHNCWGWGIHSKGTKTYESYEEAIDDVAKGISEKYCQKGLCDDPCEMMKKYTPQSNGSWCFGVKKFMAEIASGY